MQKEKMIALAQGQLDAYNKRDLEAFCNFYHPSVQVFKLAQNEKTCDGIQAFRSMYKTRFEDAPELHCELKSRVVLNDSVLDEEWVTAGAGSTPSHVVAIYSFKDNLIAHVWFVR
ncbi:MAG: nuclear transport factor 2 family protein [Bacteriovorax sp.]|nr:nuclear transport factor 2 family protein [Bacteriovorax sp.]